MSALTNIETRTQELEGGDWFDVGRAFAWEHRRPDPPARYVDRLYRTRFGHWVREWRGFVDDGHRVVALVEPAWWEGSRAAARAWFRGNGYDPELAGAVEAFVDEREIAETFTVVGREEAWRLHLLRDGRWVQEEFADDGTHVFPVRPRLVARAARVLGQKARRLVEATAAYPVDPEEV